MTAGMHMGVICYPIFVDLFLSAYETDFIQRFLKKNEKEIARSVNFTFRYIDDILSPNNSRFGFDLIFFLVFYCHFQQYFSYIMATSFSDCRRSLSTRRKPPTMGKQLVNFITCGCESRATFPVI